MIKVNLLFDKTSQPATANPDNLGDVGKQTYNEILNISDKFSEPEVHPGLKILIMIAPVALMYFYEIKIKRDAEIKVSRISAEVQQTEAIRDQKKALVESIVYLKSDYEYRKPILEEFKKISKEKVHGVKILDQLQDLLPPKVWVKDVSLDRSGIDISGVSGSDKELTQFQRNFEDSIFFENILIYNSIESKTEKGDPLISFKMKASFSSEVLGGG